MVEPLISFVVEIEHKFSLPYLGAPANEFSFSDTYNPVDFSGARLCEIRVWSFFQVNEICFFHVI